MGVESQTAGRILEAFEKIQAETALLAEEKALLEEELQECRKAAAVERAIWEAGGKNSRAIRALIAFPQISFDEENGLMGLDLEAIKAEAPYLFYEKEERTRGTGMARGQRRKENQISEAFQKGLRR